MLLIPDKLIAKLRSQSRSWTRFQPKKLLHARLGRSQESLESSRPVSAPLYTVQRQPHQAVRYDLESYGDIASQTFLDNSEAVIEPVPAVLRKENAV